MKRVNTLFAFVLSAVLLAGCVAPMQVTPQTAATSQPAAPTEAPNPIKVGSTLEDKIASALSAAPAPIAQAAAILDYPEGWPGKWPKEPAQAFVEVRPGRNGWSCLPDDPTTPGNDPICVNEVYLAVLKARYALVDAPSSGIGISYMLQEGEPIGSPAHLMIFVPGSKEGLAAFGKDPGPMPWVMYSGTTHQHLMINVAPRPAAVAAAKDKIANAMSAGPAPITQAAAILDYPEGWPGKWPKEPAQAFVEVRPGRNGWSCLPDDPTTPGNDPICVNEVYLAVLKARYALVDAPSSGIGISYMLQEGEPIGSPAHLMIFVPGSNKDLAAFGKDPGPMPWVMYPGTTYQHLMVNVFFGNN